MEADLIHWLKEEVSLDQVLHPRLMEELVQKRRQDLSLGLGHLLGKLIYGTLPRRPILSKTEDHLRGAKARRQRELNPPSTLTLLGLGQVAQAPGIIR